MKRYFIILLTLVMAACETTPDGDGGNGGNGSIVATHEFKNIVQESSRTILEVFMKKGKTPTVDESGTSTAHRIPGLLTLDDGRIAYAGDIRWGAGADSAHNIDSGIRFSEDSGKTWSDMQFIQQFDDFSHDNIPVTIDKFSYSEQAMSASFIDPGIVQAANGDLLVITTTFPRGAGIQNTAFTGETHGNKLNPFVEHKGELYIKLRPQNSSDVWNEASYTHMAPIKGGAIVDKATGNTKTDFYIDENWMVKENGRQHTGPQYDTGTSKSTMKRVPSGKMVDTHLFYYNSPWWPVGKSFIFMTRSTDGGKTWSKSRDISSQVVDPSGNSVIKDSHFYGASPGVGYRVQEGTYKNRVLVALQPVIGAKCWATSIHSDDNGKTWTAGKNVVAGTTGATRLSETQYVEGPEDQLFAFHRTGGLAKIAYSVSQDGGDTWTTKVSVLDSVAGGGVMIGATPLRQTTLFGKKMLALSFPWDSARKAGAVFIGYFEKGNDGIYVPTFPGHPDSGDDPAYRTYITPQDEKHDYGYSSLTELPNGNIGVAYEWHNAPITLGDTTGRSLDFTEIKLNREEIK